MYNKLPWKKPKLFRGNCQNPWFLKLFSFFWRGLPLIIKKCLGTSLRASYKGRSGGGAGKGRRACNYVSGIWMSASKKPVPGVRIVESRRKINEGKKKRGETLPPPPPCFPGVQPNSLPALLPESLEQASVEKVDAKCWIVEMTLAMIFHMFFNDCFHSHWLAEIWQSTGKPQGNWRRNSNSRDEVTSSPSFSTPPSERPRELAVYLETFQVP